MRPDGALGGDRIELENAVATAVGDNFVWAYQRAEALAAEVARTFVEAGLDAVKMPELSARDMGDGFGEFKSLASLEAKPIRKGDRVVSSMRGSFGGVLMFGMLTSFAGLGMVNPLSVGAGLLVGRKAYKEEMENRMLRIRSDAKMNVRRFVDDISFVVGKESRDRLRFVQRQLRDHYRGIANQTTRSLNESLQATLAAAKLEENERNTPIKELERQLNILRQVIDHATSWRPALLAPAQALANGTGSMSTSDQVRAILGGTIQAYRAIRRTAIGRCAQRARADRPAAQPADPHRAGRNAEGRQVHLGECACRRGHCAHRRHRGHPHRHLVPARSHPEGHRQPSRRPAIQRADRPRRRADLRLRQPRPEDVVDLDVEWPAAELIETTIIDTPGRRRCRATSPQRTLRLLVPDDGVPRVDAVVFLLRTLNAADIALLKQIGELVGGSAGALGVIGVASRADEIGAGRIDAMLSAKDVAKRFTAEMDKTGICQAVVPVSGSAGADRAHVRQSEFVALEKLAGVDAAELTKAMLSVDRFVREDSELPVDAATRAALAGPVRHVRDQDLDRRAARRGQRFGRAWPTSCSSAAGWSRCATSSTSSSRSGRICSRRTPRCCRCGGSWRSTRSMRRPTSSPTSTRCLPTPTPSRSCGCSANYARAQRH